MNPHRSIRFIAIALLVFVVFTADISAQENTFEPIVGQPGKDVVWVPTQQALVDKMLSLAKVTPKDYVIDLGSGDGRTVITAAKLGAKALGIEFNPDMVDLSIRNAAKEKIGDKAEFIKADLFESDISKATVITMFLLPDLNLKLRPKLLNLKPGTRLVSNTFPMGDWEPDETFQVGGECTSWCTALLWIVPAKVEGKWKLPDGELEFIQTYQKLIGTLASGNQKTAATGKVDGAKISFTAGNAEYSGEVNGDVISGIMKSGDKSASWRATR